MTIDRRKFMALIGATASAALFEACNSRGPRSAAGLLKFAERKNEGLERWIFRGGSRDRVAADAKLTPHVGHKVEITGTVEESKAATQPPAASAANAPTLKVDDLKMVAPSCK